MTTAVSPAIRYTLDTAALAAAYDAGSDFQFEHGKDLIAGLGLRLGDRVLDVGAGTGRLGAHVAEVVGPTGWVEAIDPLPLRVEHANAKGVANLRATAGSAEDLSVFADHTFNAVYLNSVFHWVEDKPRALREAFRVLKPGGRLALNSQDPEHPHQSRQFTRAAFAAIGYGPSTTAVTEPSKGITRGDLNAGLRAAGFRDVTVTLRQFVDYHADIDALIRWSASSSFGNFLADLDATAQAAFRAALTEALQPVTSSRGIRLERSLNFAYATR